MRILKSGREIEEQLLKLIDEATKIEVAVAWASAGTQCFKLLNKNQRKIERLTVGIHFYQTDPAFLEEFLGAKWFRIVKHPDGVFHPKIYFFELPKDRWCCVVGSANFTAGAFSRNVECAVLISNEDVESERQLKDIRQLMSTYWSYGEPLSKEFLESYKQVRSAKKPKLDDLKATFGDEKQKPKPSKRKKSVLESEIFVIPWAKYVERVKADALHGTNDRLKVLAEANRLFRSHKHFSDMSAESRKRIAGYLQGDLPWKYFGSMQGAGYFKNRIGNNNEFVSQALDQIPLVGDVGEEAYGQFLELYKKAFPNATNMLGTSTRLLAMKRPDYFVCIDEQNKSKFCKDFGITKSNLSCDNYWDEVIKRIQSSIWWDTPRPNHKVEGKIWDGRAAFLDALYYVPK